MEMGMQMTCIDFPSIPGTRDCIAIVALANIWRTHFQVSAGD